MTSISAYIAKIASYLVFLMMLLTVATVILRYGFNTGSIVLQEMAGYCHAAAFLLAAAYTLRCDEHVRVDIFYARMNLKQQAWVNALGTLCLMLPFIVFLLFASWDYFWASWLIKEVSAEAGGLAFVYGLKFIIPLSMFFLALEALQLFYNAAKILLLANTLSTPDD